VEFLPASSGPEPFQVLLRGQEVTDEIRTDAAGVDASRVASMSSVRDGLAQLQRGFRKAPGLIADGRDMGTVIFTDAAVKIFLTASAEVRAERRYKQLKNKGMDVSLAALLQSIRERDARDASRPVAPLKPAEDAMILDSSALSLDAVHKAVWEVVEQNVLLGANSFAE
jgi:cytidylate kinase